MTDSALDGLRAIVGAAHVLDEPDMRAGYETDWTGRYSGRCGAVVRPATTTEVADVLRLCNETSISVVAQAGNTGLVGGGVPRHSPTTQPTIVLSMSRLRVLGAVDRAAMQVTAGAGVTLTDWRAHARAAGLDTPVDFAARDSATIGGALATNAGGSRVLRFGTMRQQAVGIEAVLANGQVVGSLSGLPKETVGLHLPSVLAGSEGTLAIITAARLRLVPWYEQTITALLAVDTIDNAIELLGTLRRNVPSLDAVELVEPAAMELVATHLGERPPFKAPPGGHYLVIDCADHADPSDEFLAAIEDVSGVTDAAVTNDALRRGHLLKFRDGITEAISVAATNTGQPTFKLDVAVPLAELGHLLEVAHEAAAEDGATLIPFGHLAEGNLHLNHLGSTNPQRIADRVLGAVAEMGGTISAEHGVGIAKTPWMHLIRSTDDLAAQRSIKQALDPNGILNPGVLDADAGTPGQGGPQVP